MRVQPTEVEMRQQLQEVEQHRYAYLLEGDAQSYSRLCHPELIFVHSTGTVETKEAFLKPIQSGEVRYDEVEHPIHATVLSNKTGVVVGDLYAQLRVNGVPVTLRNRTLATWVYGESEWLLISHIGTRLPDTCRLFDQLR